MISPVWFPCWFLGSGAAKEQFWKSSEKWRCKFKKWWILKLWLKYLYREFLLRKINDCKLRKQICRTTVNWKQSLVINSNEMKYEYSFIHTTCLFASIFDYVLFFFCLSIILFVVVRVLFSITSILASSLMYFLLNVLLE